MGQPKVPEGRTQLFHVNFHTARNRPVFEVPEYDALLRRLLPEIIEKWNISCLAWQIMPTHVHLILLTFPDQQLARVVQLIKGSSGRAMLEIVPELREDLGDHLWRERYD